MKGRGRGEHFFSLSGFPPSALSSLCWRKANFHLHSFSFSCPRLKRPRALHVYWVLGTCSFWVLNPNQCVGNFNSGEMAEAARDYRRVKNDLQGTLISWNEKIINTSVVVWNRKMWTYKSSWQKERVKTTQSAGGHVTQRPSSQCPEASAVQLEPKR